MMANRRSSKHNKPKRPRTGYNLFFHHQLPRVKAALRRETGQTDSFQQISVRLSTLWKALGAQEKTKYMVMAAKDKRRYALEKVQWQMQREHGRSGQVVPASEREERLGAESTTMTEKVAEAGSALQCPPEDVETEAYVPQIPALASMAEHILFPEFADMDEEDAAFFEDVIVTL